MNDILQLSSFFPVFFIAIFFSILFIQSGFDKIFDFNENLKFLNHHFEKTLFKNHVRFLFIVLTLLEVLTGLIFLIGLIGSILFELAFVMKIFFIALVMANLTICCLFLGQRISKEYVGAANLVGYFLVAFLSFLFF